MRVVAPKAGRDLPAVLPGHLLLTHHVADRSPRPPARTDALDRIGDHDLVERPLDLLRGKARSEVARHVVEAKCGQHDGVRLNPIVNEPDELLLAGRVEVVGARGHRGLNGREAEIEERAGERRDHARTFEGRAQRRRVASVGDAHLLARRGERVQRFAAPPDEPHLEALRAGPRRAPGGP